MKIRATFNDGTVIEGTVIDNTIDNRYILIENELDTYNIDTMTVSIEDIGETAHTIHMDVRTAKKKIKEITNQAWGELERTEIQVFNFNEDGQEGFDVEIALRFEDGESEFVITDTFPTQEQAEKRAKQLKKSFKDSTYNGVYTV